MCTEFIDEELNLKYGYYSTTYINEETNNKETFSDMDIYNKIREYASKDWSDKNFDKTEYKNFEEYFDTNKQVYLDYFYSIYYEYEPEWSRENEDYTSPCHSCHHPGMCEAIGQCY